MIPVLAETKDCDYHSVITPEYQVLGFHQQPIVTDVVGALLILSTVVAITVEKARNERAQTLEQEALDASVASQESF